MQSDFGISKYAFLAGTLALIASASLSGCGFSDNSQQKHIAKLVRDNNPTEMLKYCDQEIAKTPNTSELYVYRGQAKRLLGKLPEAKEDLEKAVELRSDREWYYRELGDVYLECQQYKDALAAFTKAKEMMEANSPEACYIFASIAATQQRMGDYRESVKSATESLALKPNQKYALSTRTMSYLQSYRDAEALDDANKLIELDDKDAAAYAFHGWVAFLADDIKTAQADCDKARTLNPKSWEALDLQLSLYLMKGDNAAALAIADDAVKAAPDKSLGYADKAHCLFIMKDFKQAMPLAEKALGLEPKSIRALTICNMLYGVQGAEAKAFELLKRQDDLSAAPQVARNKCRTYFFLKKYDETVKLCSEALANDPDDAGLYRLRAEAYKHLGKSKEAEADLKASTAKGHSKNAVFDLYLKAV